MQAGLRVWLSQRSLEVKDSVVGKGVVTWGEGGGSKGSRGKRGREGEGREGGGSEGGRKGGALCALSFAISGATVYYKYWMLISLGINKLPFPLPTEFRTGKTQLSHTLCGGFSHSYLLHYLHDGIIT